MSDQVADSLGEAARILKDDGVRIHDAERVAYYRLYREVFGPPRGDP